MISKNACDHTVVAVDTCHNSLFGRKKFLAVALKQFADAGNGMPIAIVALQY
jgi:hypothetical protein